jgi:hypothetical protein
MAKFGYLKYADSLIRDATLQAKDPDDSAYAAYTVDSNFPLANVKTIPVQRPTKIEIPTDSDTHVHVQIDFGASSDFDLVVIAGHNLSSTASVELYAGASLYPSTLIGTMTWTADTMFHKFTSTQSARYLMLDIDDANSTYDDVSIGLLMAGEYTETGLTIAEGWEQVSRAENIRNAGDWITPISRNLFNRKMVSLPFSNVLESDFDDMVTLYEDLAQDVFPAFILPDLSVRYGFVGRFTEPLSREYPHSNSGSGAGDDLISAQVDFIEDANPILLNGTQWTP